MFLINIVHAGVITEAPNISALLLNILNFILQIFGLIGIISLLISGIFYLAASGSEDRMKMAKKGMIFSIVGILIALSGIVIIKTIIGFLK